MTISLTPDCAVAASSRCRAGAKRATTDRPPCKREAQYRQQHRGRHGKIRGQVQREGHRYQQGDAGDDAQEDDLIGHGGMAREMVGWSASGGGTVRVPRDAR